MLVSCAELPQEQIVEFLTKRWGTTRMVVKGRMHHLDELPGVAYLEDGQIVGMATYRMEGTECELASLNSTVRHKGIGRSLLQEVERLARESGCTRLWCITTNDNIRAIRFYQLNGMSLCRLYPNALEAARKLKPEIPLTGQDGIAIEHELEFEMRWPA
ncbi:GNAT family N-acetyltransferase [Gorillibacterium sp. sgz500922]|uniref:GNAT family N-acetyltransferase n=1 Tax=Gorillibacterium sp. sgz500922 TaxID=3446694 RepID=UPI003F674771